MVSRPDDVRPRICSLIPSATEIVYALGLGDSLVGVSHECDYPHECIVKPKVTRSTIGNHMGSQAIDTRVREELQSRGTLYVLDLPLLARLSPDIILTQELCTVCAVSYESVSRAVHSLEHQPAIVNLEPTSIEGIFENIRTVGALGGVMQRAEELVSSLRSRLMRVQSITRNCARPRVVCLEWIDPPFCAGHWIPELVEIAGGVDELGRKHQPSQAVAWEQIVSYNPDAIVVMCCGFTVERTLKEIDRLMESPIGLCSAIEQGNLFVVDGNAYFSRPGPRIADGAGILATIFHPDLYPIDYPTTVVHKVDVHRFSNIM